MFLTRNPATLCVGKFENKFNEFKELNPVFVIIR